MVHLVLQCAHQRFGVVITMVLGVCQVEVRKTPVFGKRRGPCCKGPGADDHPIPYALVRTSSSKYAVIA